MNSGDRELLERVPAQRLAANGVPDPGEGAARERGARILDEALRSMGIPLSLHASPLGPAWSGDLDAFVPTPPPSTALRDLGWLPLDPLLRRLGSDPGSGRWAVMDGIEVLTCVDFTVGSPPDPVASIADRCRRRRSIRAREVLELRVLRREGFDLSSAGEVLRLAARAEAGLGGGELSAWVDGPPLAAPVDLPGSRLRRLWRLRPSLRPRLVVALSGVDGAGKSTLSTALSRDLQRVGVPVSVVWTRPGMGIGLGWVERLAGLVKRAMGHGSAPGVRRVAAGEVLPWRRGPVAWSWAMLITLSFLADVRWQHLRGIGILLYDRHLLDGLVTLDFVYGGVDLTAQRALIRRLLPGAELSFFLDVPPEVAISRKPGDSFGELAVRRQIQGYEALLGEVPGLRRLDATLPGEELAAAVFRALVEPGPSAGP